MTKSLAVRSAVASTLVAASTVALANEGPEGLGELQGPAALLYLLGGVAALGVVVWLMTKFLGRDKKS